MRAGTRQSGATLLELVVVLAIGTILMLVAGLGMMSPAADGGTLDRHTIGVYRDSAVKIQRTLQFSVRRDHTVVPATAFPDGTILIDEPRDKDDAGVD